MAAGKSSPAARPDGVRRGGGEAIRFCSLCLANWTKAREKGSGWERPASTPACSRRTPPWKVEERSGADHTRCGHTLWKHKGGQGKEAHRQQPNSQIGENGPSPQVGSAPAARVPEVVRLCEMFSTPGSLPEPQQPGRSPQGAVPTLRCHVHRPGQGSGGGGRNPELGGETK